jgi:hypothetical protein
MENALDALAWFDEPDDETLFSNLRYASVYALGPAGGTQVRVSWTKNPKVKFAQLQEAHWRPLVLHHLAWMPGVPVAKRLMAEIEQILGGSGRKIRGSWYDLPASLIEPCFQVAACRIGITTWTHETMMDSVRAINREKEDRALRKLGLTPPR